MKVEVFGRDSQFSHVFFGASGVAADKVWYDLLSEILLFVDIVKNFFELFKQVERRFTHQLQHIVRCMFRCNLKSSAYVSAYQFTCV